MCVLLLAAEVNHITNISRAALWAGLAGNWALNASCAAAYYDADNTGGITKMRQYVFTERDPTAASDMEALAAVFDTNWDGELSGVELDDFRIMVSNADGWAGMATNAIAKCWAHRVLLANTA